MTARHLVGARTGIRWYNLFGDLESATADNDRAQTLADYMSGFLTRPHPELGRTGAVCPFVKISQSKETVWATFLPGDTDVSNEMIHRILDDAFDLFGMLRREFHHQPTQTIIVAFPDLTDFSRIDAIHAARKSQFVARGHMLGQFYPGCSQQGLWNADFKPLDAPVPMLIVRKMMSTDYPFLAGDREWLYSYFTQFAPELPIRLRSAMAERMVIDSADATDFAALRVHNADEHAR